MQRLRTRLRASASRGAPAALSLDFLSASGTLDPRITFSRGSNATLTDSTGKITYAPTNLLTNSESFDASSWTKTEITIVPNNAVAPDGTTTADKAVPTTVTGTHQINSATLISSTQCVISIYAKSGGYDTITILDRAAAASGASFNLTTGAVSNVGSGVGSAVSVGNGWWRCAVYVATTGARFYIPTSSSVFAGDGTSGVFLWGAQLEQVTYQTTPGTYNSTTPKNLLGFTQEFDNAAWTKTNAFVQTNLLTYSQDFGNAAWSSNAVTRVDNAIAAPDGTLTAEQFTPTTASATHTFWQIVSSVTSGATYSASYYIKPNGYTKVAIVENNITSAYTSFDLSGAGSVITNSAGSSGSVTAVGGGWYRIVHSSASGGTAFRPQLFILPNSYTSGTPTNSWVGDGTSGIYAWGAQLVQGSTAGDYQRTDAAAAAVQYYAPDGTLSADKLVETTAANIHYAYQAAGSTLIAGSTVAVSGYAKAGERTYVTVGLSDISVGSVYAVAVFNLANGTVTTSGASGTGYSVSSTSITPIGNGWYRCSVVCVVGSSVTFARAAFGVNRTGTINSVAGGMESYTGDGTSGIYIWGAQLSDSASLDPYVYNPAAAAASAAYYGPRFDYDPVTLAAKGLLIEEQRTNIVLRSAEFDNVVWSPSAATISANVTLAPDGTSSADKLAETATTAEHYVEQSVSFTTGTTYTFSFYAKAAEQSVVAVRSTSAWAADPRIRFTLTGNGTVTVDNGTPTGTITPVGNGWYRCTMTATTNATIGGVIRFSLYNGAYSYLGTAGAGAYLYGAQLEAGSFATSYIPTAASQVTRSADVALMQGANFSSWYNQNEGTVSLVGDTIGYTLNQMAASITDGTITNPVQIYNNSGLQLEANVWSNGTVLSTFTYSSLFKYALGLATNNVGASINGGSVVSDLSVGPPVAYNRLNIGNRNGSLFWNGHIRSIGYYNTRQPNATLQTLTNPSTTPSLALNFISDTYTVGA